MKHIIKHVLIAAAIIESTSFSLLAGILEPTNAPAPTMYSLEEIYEKLLSMEQRLVSIEDCLNCGSNTNQPPYGEMSLIPAGSFVMGDAMSEYGGGAFTNEVPVHVINVNAFYIDKYEVTKALWDEVHTWAMTNAYAFGSTAESFAPNHPVYSVDWFDAIAFCNARSEREGLTPCYTNASGTVYKNSLSNSFDGDCNWSANGYRLPTEAEWEKAARGGVAGQRFPWGDTISHSNATYNAMPSLLGYDVNPVSGLHPVFSTLPPPYTSPVGYFAPNGYGLYDVAGNVTEWCWDWFSGDYYSSSPSSNPQGPSSGVYRVMRGGSSASNAGYLRLASRDNMLPSFPIQAAGFRCVRGR